MSSQSLIFVSAVGGIRTSASHKPRYRYMAQQGPLPAWRYPEHLSLLYCSLCTAAVSQQSRTGFAARQSTYRTPCVGLWSASRRPFLRGRLLGLLGLRSPPCSREHRMCMLSMHPARKKTTHTPRSKANRSSANAFVLYRVRRRFREVGDPLTLALLFFLFFFFFRTGVSQEKVSSGRKR